MIALVLSCVAITMFSVGKPGGMNGDESEKLDDHEKRLRDIELKILGLTPIPGPPSKISEIIPIEAFQISVFVDNNNGGIKFPADRVIDGNVDTMMYTNHATNPWWAADMGGIYYVTRVEVTNSWNYPKRSENLRVGVTNMRPEIGKDARRSLGTWEKLQL